MADWETGTRCARRLGARELRSEEVFMAADDSRNKVSAPEKTRVVTKMEVRGASKSYQTRSGSVHALDNVSLDVREGEFLCILGPSGCGKTTLLWSMAGLHELSSGQVLLDNKEIGRAHV